MHPSHALYQSLQTAYEHFNAELFDGQLPDVMFTVQRQKDVLGYFAPDRWSSPEGHRCHEIAINPAHMAQSRVIDVLQTLVHEMVHCWQHCHGKPGRSYYHNREWAYKMMAVGLQPSSTGAPGGHITGQHMSDYPVEDGRFIHACDSLVKNYAFRLPWIYRLALPADDNADEEKPNVPDEQAVLQTQLEGSDDTVMQLPTTAPETFLHSTYRDVLPEGTFIIPARHRPSRVKYQCPGCYVGVWGKPGIQLICGQCRMEFMTL
jgi:hypothetical protein